MKISNKAKCFIFTSTVLVAFTIYFFTPSAPRHFKSFVKQVASNPETYIGKQIGISTYFEDNELLRSATSSKDVNKATIWAFQKLSSTLQKKPITYYAEPASMPTQETIWQYTGFFVRLYVTSSLDSDGVYVGVFSGSYQEFRKGRISQNTEENRSDLYIHFSVIPFKAPNRFLANR